MEKAKEMKCNVPGLCSECGRCCHSYMSKCMHASKHTKTNECASKCGDHFCEPVEEDETDG